MKEELISFETAKLAKEKGFSEKTMYWHYIEEGNYDPINSAIIPTDFNERFGDRYSLPTQSLLQKWLREEYEIHVYITPYGKRVKEKFEEWSVSMIRELKLSSEENHMNHWDDRKFWDSVTFKTYELALEKGLQSALKLLK